MAYTARTTLAYWTEGSVIGPGSGYFPFWISMILSVLTLYWLIQVTIRPGEEMAKNFIPPRHEGMLALVIFMDMILFIAIVDYTGFPVAMFIFLMAMVVALGERTLRHMIYYVIFSVGITAFFVIVFGEWLEVAFPKAGIEIFKAMGL
jgi:hypothetical protein